MASFFHEKLAERQTVSVSPGPAKPPPGVFQVDGRPEDGLRNSNLRRRERRPDRRLRYAVPHRRVFSAWKWCFRIQISFYGGPVQRREHPPRSIQQGMNKIQPLFQYRYGNLSSRMNLQDNVKSAADADTESL